MIDLISYGIKCLPIIGIIVVITIMIISVVISCKCVYTDWFSNNQLYRVDRNDKFDVLVCGLLSIASIETCIVIELISLCVLDYLIRMVI